MGDDYLGANKRRELEIAAEANCIRRAELRLECFKAAVGYTENDGHPANMADHLKISDFIFDWIEK